MRSQILVFVLLTVGGLQADPKPLEFYNTYRNLETRFNGELAGQYPFGDFGSRQASPIRVRNFFNDYEGQFLAIRDGLEKDFPGEGDISEAQYFLKRLSKVETLMPSLLMAPTGLEVTFWPKASKNVPQPSAWSIGDGYKQVPCVEGMGATFIWTIGTPIVIETIWLNPPSKDSITWKPDPRRSKIMDIEVRGETARFVVRSDWAILQLMDNRAGGGTHRHRDPILEFRVPLVGNRKNALPQTVSVSGKFSIRPSHLPSSPIVWPDSFPWFAPRIPSRILLDRMRPTDTAGAKAN
jgi:hypothetical protein